MFEISSSFTGQTSTPPNITKIFTSANYATITTAGWLNRQISLPNTINPLDEFHIRYNVSGGSLGTLGIFFASITAGETTLVPVIFDGNVHLPVISGDIAVFDGTSGRIKDSLVSFTAPALTKVASAQPTTYIVNNILTSYDTAGSSKPGSLDDAQQQRDIDSTSVANYAFTGVCKLLAETVASGYAYGLRGYVEANNLTTGTISGQFGYCDVSGAIGAGVQISGVRARALINDSSVTVTTIVSPFIAEFGEFGDAPTGDLSQCAMFWGQNNLDIEVGALFNFTGQASTFITFGSLGGSTIFTSADGVTPSATTPMKLRIVDHTGTPYFILCARDYT